MEREMKFFKREIKLMFQTVRFYNAEAVAVAVERHACGCIYIAGVGEKSELVTSRINFVTYGIRRGARGDETLIKDCYINGCREIVSVDIIWPFDSAFSAKERWAICSNVLAQLETRRDRSRS